jgi:hypothetical protein
MKRRIRYSNPQLEFLPTENIGRLRRGLSMEVSMIGDESMDNFHRNRLMETVRRIE